MTELERIRDELLRDVWAIQKRVENPLVRNIDLACDERASIIDIVIDGQHFPLVTRSEIEDGTYKNKYVSRVNDALGSRFGAPLVVR